MKQVSKEKIQYILVNNEIFKSVPFDQWEDGDFEADSLDGGVRVLISKNEGKYFVANAMNGYGHNCKKEYENATVSLLYASQHQPAGLHWVKASERLPEFKGWVFCKNENGRRDMVMANGVAPWPHWAEFWLSESPSQSDAVEFTEWKDSRFKKVGNNYYLIDSDKEEPFTLNDIYQLFLKSKQ